MDVDLRCCRALLRGGGGCLPAQSLSRAGLGGYLSAAFPEHPLRQKPVAQP